MCGITAVFTYSGEFQAQFVRGSERMLQRMASRGPDGHGEWSDRENGITLGHRRLAIIDLSQRGAQPMRNRDGTLAVTFNGEIYNYRELRHDLERKGRQFASESDTEVLLQLYEEYGEDFVRQLRGMFAFALWDARCQGLLLARDPFGIKPIYYANNGRTITVASEVKALLATGMVSKTPSAAGQVGFFMWGHVPEPFTFYEDIRALEAGHLLWIDRQGNRRDREFASVDQLLVQASERADRSRQDATASAIGDAVRDSVRHHLIADVDVGVFLSAGRDSTTLASLAAEVSPRIRTVTLGFEEYRGTMHDETVIAEAVARQLGTSHQTVWITRSDFDRELTRLLDRMDQPSIDGVNSYFVALAASQAGLKVAISGLGGDELFGGYPSFTQIPRVVSLVRPFFRPTLARVARRLSAPMLGRLFSPKYASLLEYGNDFGRAYLLRRALFLPWELPTVLDEEVVREGLSELDTLGALGRTIDPISSTRLKISALESTWYMRNQLLRDTDWASMSHSLEVRVPLVDWTLWSTIAPVLAGNPSIGKHELVMTPRAPLPDSVLTRPKSGFTTPTAQWIRDRAGRQPDRGLRAWAREIYRAA